MAERKGGGARRGPFAKKRVTFATRLTEETMDMLARAAERDGLSISQKAEQVLLAGLRSEDIFERSVMPVIEAFREKARRAIEENDGKSPEKDAKVAWVLHEAARELAASFPILMQDKDQVVAKAVAGHVRGQRQLLVEDDPATGED